MSRPFFIAASSRKGTHLIETALARRPDVQVHGQVFSFPDFHPACNSAELASLLFDQYQDVAIVSGAWRAGIDRYPEIWDEMRARRVGVIHLHRRNMLRWYVSLRIAETTNNWISVVPPTDSTIRVLVDLVDFQNAIEVDRDYERQIDEWFTDSHVLHIWYEDMAADFAAHIKRVQWFLGLRPVPLTPGCYKQQRLPLSEVISNYAELATAWAGTPWETFLRDDPCSCVLPLEDAK